MEETLPNTSSAIEKPKSTKEEKYSVLKKRNYVLHKTIGHGYCGIVKLATSKTHGCNVAIKIVMKFNSPNDYLTKFFPREIETVKGLQHPNIIQYYHAIETTHRIYIIMEYAVNGNLFEYIQSHNYVNEPQSKNWFGQLLNVIEYCHNRGIVHRDIKCENLLLDENLNIKLSDFGFARRIIRINNNVGLVSTFCGSYAYAAPEILKGQSYDPTLADVWSMGVVLYAMVYGCLPFDDSNYFVLIKQVRREIRFPNKPKVSKACRDLIIHILKPRKERPTITAIKSNSWLSIDGENAENTTTENPTIDTGSESPNQQLDEATVIVEQVLSKQINDVIIQAHLDDSDYYQSDVESHTD